MAQTTENTISGSYIIPLKANEISDRLLKVPSLNIFCYTENKCYLDTENPHNIVVEIEHRIYDGMEIKFKAPEACSEVAGLTVHATFYETGGAKANTYSYFEFVDAYGNKAEDVFKKDAIVKVVLTDIHTNADDKVVGNARILNAHTNSYLEEQLDSISTSITNAKTELAAEMVKSKAELNTVINNVDSRVSLAETDIENADARITDLDNRVNAVKANVDAASTNISNLESSVSSIESSVSTLTTTINTNATNANAHAADKNNPHGVDAEQIGAVPTSRTVNNKSLSSNISLSASDVGAMPTRPNVAVDLKAVGWYRIGTVNMYGCYRLTVSTRYGDTEDMGVTVDIVATNSNPTITKTAVAFQDTNIKQIDKIRLVKGTDCYYVDIHYNVSASNTVKVRLDGPDGEWITYAEWPVVSDNDTVAAACIISPYITLTANNDYGDTYPSNPTTGQLFFKKVSS